MEKKGAHCHHCQNHRPASDHSIAKNSADTVGAGIFPRADLQRRAQPAIPFKHGDSLSRHTRLGLPTLRKLVKRSLKTLEKLIAPRATAQTSAENGSASAFGGSLQRLL